MKKKTELRVRAPRGFHFKIDARSNKKYPGDDYTILHLYNNKIGYEVGHVSLYRHINKKSREDYWETHSELDEDYHGKGFGTLMYAKAIQWCLDRGLKVRSSGSSSDHAQRVWNGQGIRKFFSIRKRLTRYGKPQWSAYR